MQKKNILVTDAQVGAVKLITDASSGKLYEAFSVHPKHKRQHTSTLQEAEQKTKTVFDYLQNTVQSVQTLLGTSKKINGPEGTIASKTVKSVGMINEGLMRLTKNIEMINPVLAFNPEALLTVKVENLHAVSHFKHPILSMPLACSRSMPETLVRQLSKPPKE